MKVTIRLNDLKLRQKRMVYDKGFQVLMGLAPKVEGVRTYENVAYLSDGNPWHLLDIHYPADTKETLPCVVYLHGGGWSNVDKSYFHHYCCTLASEGFVVFNADYRLAPDYRYPAQVEDALAAVRWVQENAARYGANPQRLFLVGDSAGAHLCAMLACLYTNPAYAEKLGYQEQAQGVTIAGTGLLCGAFDIERAVHVKSPNISAYLKGLLNIGSVRVLERSGKWVELSPLLHVTAGFPPSFLTHAKADGLFAQSVAMAQVLETNHVRHACLFLDGRDNAYFHDYQLVYFFPVYRRGIRAMAEFFQQCIDEQGADI